MPLILPAESARRVLEIFINLKRRLRLNFTGLLTTFTQMARAESWSWENFLPVVLSENAVAVSPL